MRESVNNPILYVKQGCPWCIDALAYFKQNKVELEIIDARSDPVRLKELEQISGQTMTPTLKHGDFLVKDFDLDEFKQALDQNPQAAKKLGLSDSACPARDSLGQGYPIYTFNQRLRASNRRFNSPIFCRRSSNEFDSSLAGISKSNVFTPAEVS